jgi:hypothetical protein
LISHSVSGSCLALECIKFWQHYDLVWLRWKVEHELHGSVLVMDGEHVVAIIYHCSISCDKATKACQTTLWFFW